MEPAKLLPLRSTPGHPVSVSVDWKSKTVASRQPVDARWEEYRLEWQLHGELPLFAAILLGTGGHVRYGRLPAEPRCPQALVRLGFTRYRVADEWPDQKLVHVNLYQTSAAGGDGLREIVTSEGLWLDPRELVRPFLPEALTTGMLVPLAMVFRPTIKASMIVLGEDEVHITRDRWQANERVLDRLAGFSFLTTGRRTGQITE